MQPARYDHVQRGPLHLMLHGTAAGLVVGALASPDEPYVRVALGIAALGTFVMAFAMHHLRIRDEGSGLLVRYGPLPLFRKVIPYESVRSVTRARTTLLDGFGLHYVPFRGWTWNVWGFDSVRVKTDKQTVFLGTDDPEGLLDFLERRTGLPPRAEA